MINNDIRNYIIWDVNEDRQVMWCIWLLGQDYFIEVEFVVFMGIYTLYGRKNGVWCCLKLVI